jgi:hypothetical protein
MKFEMLPYIVYAKINDSGYITAVNSSEFLTDTTGWIEIDSGYGDKYHHAQGNYFPECIITEGSAYRYKLVGGKVIECTAKEIAEQEKAIQDLINSQPSQNDLIEAQIMYTAMMTDTLLV